METIKDKLKKIKALSEQGYFGEAENAKLLLNRMLEKYNLSLNDLKNDELIVRKFKVERMFNTVFVHIVAKITGDRYRDIFYYKGKPSVQHIQLTDYEFVEIQQMFDFHKKQYKKEFEKQILIIKKAYIHKHNLAQDSTGDSESKDVDMDEIRNILSAMDRMEDRFYHKQLKQ